MCWDPFRCPGVRRLVVANAAREIIDGLSRDGASGQQATPLEEEAEAEGSLRLRPARSLHSAAADHPLAVCGISEEIQTCAYVRTV